MDMLSFTPTEASCEALSAEAARFPALRELLDETAAMEGVRCALHAGCLLARVEADEGEYAFFAPAPYREDADSEAALCALERYAVREEIPLVFTDLCECEHASLAPRYPHARTYPLPGEGRYLLYVMTEADLLTALPTLSGERVTLSPPCYDDAAAYGALCRDRSNMRLFGYNDLFDHPTATDRALVGYRLAEWERRTALPFFIYHNGAMIGELVLFAFDGRAAADISFRLLPEAQGQGLASDAVRTAIAFARDGLGLSLLRGECHRDNLPSRRLLTALMGEATACGERLCFSVPLKPASALDPKSTP